MITILMATYNGEKYIKQQLDSLLKQTVQEFKIIIYDDCSSDNTFEILKSYQKKYPYKIYLHKTDKNSGNAKYTFMKMMIEYKDDYLMLCDQDDVWFEDKVEKSLRKIKQVEKSLGAGIPILVHTDLHVVDEDLNTISKSYKKAMNSDFSITSLNSKLIQNTLTGCTAIYNKALSELIFEEPKYMIMHDWWLMLIASAFGTIQSIDMPTIYYRQHSNNSIGAKDVRTLKYKINKLINYKDMQKAINDTYEQAYYFFYMYKNKLTNEKNNLLIQYIDIPNKNKLGRFITICKLKTLKHGIARKIAAFIFI